MNIKRTKNLVRVFALSFSLLLVSAAENRTFGDLAKELPSRPILSLDDFIFKATKNPFFEQILIDQLDLQYSEILALPAGDLVLSLKGEYALAHLQGDSLLPSATAHAFNGSVGLSKLFTQSGTSLSGGFSANSWGNSPGAGFYFNLAQPIAQNAFGKNNRRIASLAKLKNSITEIQIIEAYEDYLASLLVLYYNWYSNYSRVLNGLNSINTSSQLLNEMKRKFNYRIADQLDVNKSTLQLYSTQQSLTNLESSYIQCENEILMAAGLPSGTKFRPELKDYVDFTSLNLDEIVETFFENGRSIEALNFLNSQSQLQREITAEQLLPSADLYARYSVNGAGYSFENGGITHGLQIGLNLDYPILSQRIKANVAKADIDIQRTGLSASNKILKLKLEVENFSENLKKINSVLELGNKMLVLARQIAVAEQEDYNLGASDLNFLLNALNSRDNYESQLISNKVQLNTLMIEFLRLTDSLVVKLPAEK